jgi:hypothetical protein
MKRTTLTHFLTAGLAICLLTACTKEENEYDLEARMNIPLPQVTYEANWVVDRMVIDNTKFDYYYDGGVRVWHMPNQLLLQDVLPISQWNLPPNDLNELSFPLQNLGFNKLSSFYNNNTYNHNIIPGEFTSDSYDTKYNIRNGEEVYSIHLACKIDGTYEYDTDQWTMKWTVEKLKVYSSSADSIIATHTFEPALTMMLISTKRL